DQIEAGGVDLGDGALRVVVAHAGADLARKRHVHRPADLAVLVLDVELDRVQAAVLHRDVLLELARDAGERHRHVYAANLLRKRPRLQAARPLWLRDRARRGPDGIVPGDVGRDHAADHAGRDEGEQRAGEAEAAFVSTLPRLGAPHLVTRVRVDRLEDAGRGPRRPGWPGLRQGVKN